MTRLHATARAIVVAASALIAPATAGAQYPPTRDTGATPALYARVAPLQLTLTANLGQLRSDRDTNAPWRTGTLAYVSDAGTVTVPARFRTRGVWRLKHCVFPPLRADFRDRAVRGTLFSEVGRPKLVNFCRDNDAHEQYILQEYQLYRAYSLVTPLSFRTRLARVAYVDSASGRTHATRYAIIAEDPDEFAKRMDGKVVRVKGARPSDLDAEPLALAYLFQYMIGNSDFSFNGLHNTQLVGTTDGHMIPIAYDFDYTGVVDATYAVPNQALRLANIRERRFRGPCELGEEYARMLPYLRGKREAIYALWSDEIGQLVRPERTRQTLAYLDVFFRQIETLQLAQRAFLKDCVR